MSKHRETRVAEILEGSFVHQHDDDPVPNINEAASQAIRRKTNARFAPEPDHDSTARRLGLLPPEDDA